MSEEINKPSTSDKPATSENEVKTEASELAQVKAQADKLGIKYSGNTGLKTLSDKVNKALEEEAETEKAIAAEAEEVALKAKEKAEKKAKKAKKAANKAAKAKLEAEEEIMVAKAPAVAQYSNSDLIKMDAKQYSDPALRRRIIRAQALRLVRVKITNLDPSDASVPGAIITISNKYTGKVSKFIPNGSDEPYHVPQMILNHLKDKKFLLRKEIPGGKYGIKKYKTTYAKKYAIEVLPMLTPKELADLAATQKATGSVKPD